MRQVGLSYKYHILQISLENVDNNRKRGNIGCLLGLLWRPAYIKTPILLYSYCCSSSRIVAILSPQPPLSPSFILLSPSAWSISFSSNLSNPIFSNFQRRHQLVSVQEQFPRDLTLYTLTSSCLLQKLEKIGFERFEENELDHATIPEEEEQ